MKTASEILEGATVSTYRLFIGGRYIRMATQVNLADGRRVRWLDKMSKREAIENTRHQIERGNLDKIAESIVSEVEGIAPKSEGYRFVVSDVLGRDGGGFRVQARGARGSIVTSVYGRAETIIVGSVFFR